MDGRFFDNPLRVGSQSRRAAIATVLVAAGGLASASTLDAKKRRRKNKNRCTSGPCDYASCLQYVDSEAAKHPDNLANRAGAESAKKYCCGGCSSLGCSSGKAFRDRAISCVATWFG